MIAVQQVQLFLYELFAESNKPMPPTGPKQWSFKLTPRQRQLLEGLPVAAPAEQSVRAAREAAFALFFAEIPAMAKSNGPGPTPEHARQAVIDLVTGDAYDQDAYVLTSAGLRSLN